LDGLSRSIDHEEIVVQDADEVRSGQDRAQLERDLRRIAPCR